MQWVWHLRKRKFDSSVELIVVIDIVNKNTNSWSKNKNIKIDIIMVFLYPSAYVKT
jgi:hypothetical protein